MLMNRVVLTKAFVENIERYICFYAVTYFRDEVCSYEIGRGIFVSHLYEVAQVKNG